MSSYLQRLFSRASAAPAAADMVAAAPAARLASPIAEADQRLNLPGFETAALDAAEDAAVETTADWDFPAPVPRPLPRQPTSPAADFPTWQPATPRPAGEANPVPILTEAPREMHGLPVSTEPADFHVARVSPAEPAPLSSPIAPVPTTEAPTFSPAARPQPANPLPAAEPAPLRAEPRPAVVVPLPQRPRAEAPLAPSVIPAADPLPLPQAEAEPAAAPSETARPAPRPVEADVAPRAEPNPAPLKAATGSQTAQELPQPSPTVVIRELVVEVKAPPNPTPSREPAQRPRTAEAASIIGPLPIRRRTVGIFGMRRR